MSTDVIEHEKEMRKQCLLYKALTETNYSTADYCITRIKPYEPC